MLILVLLGDKRGREGGQAGKTGITSPDCKLRISSGINSVFKTNGAKLTTSEFKVVSSSSYKVVPPDRIMVWTAPF